MVYIPIVHVQKNFYWLCLNVHFTNMLQNQLVLDLANLYPDKI